MLSGNGFSEIIITDRGLEVLKQNPLKIDDDFLRQFPKHIEESILLNNNKNQDNNNNMEVEISKKNKTPEELLESNYQTIRNTLKIELLNKIKSCSPQFFERVVVELLVSMGYGGSIKEAGQAIGRTGDEGIDGMIKEDILGLDVIFIQAKKWDGTIGSPEIREFAGALQGKKAKKGVFITTSDFSDNAKEFVNNIDNKIVLVNGKMLTEYMIDHNIGGNRYNLIYNKKD